MNIKFQPYFKQPDCFKSQGILKGCMDSSNCNNLHCGFRLADYDQTLSWSEVEYSINKDKPIIFKEGKEWKNRHN